MCIPPNKTPSHGQSLPMPEAVLTTPPPNKTPSHGQSLPIPGAVLTTPPQTNPLPRAVTAYTRGCAHDTPPNKPPPTSSHCLYQRLCSRHTTKQTPSHGQSLPIPGAVLTTPPKQTPSHGQSLPIPEAVYHQTKPPPTASHCLYQGLCSRHTTKQTPSHGQSLPIPGAVLTTPPKQTPSHGQSLPIPEAVYHHTKPPPTGSHCLYQRLCTTTQNPLPRAVTAYTRGCAHDIPPNKTPPTASHCLYQRLSSRHTTKQNPLPRAVTAYTRGCVPPHKTPSHGQSLPIPEAVLTTYHQTKPPPTGSHCLYQRLCTTTQNPLPRPVTAYTRGCAHDIPPNKTPPTASHCLYRRLCSRHTTKQNPSHGQSLPIPEAVLTSGLVRNVTVCGHVNTVSQSHRRLQSHLGL